MPRTFNTEHHDYLQDEVNRLTAEVEVLRGALKNIDHFLCNKEWGTWPYMEGSEVYTDIDNAKKIVLQALSLTLKPSERK